MKPIKKILSLGLILSLLMALCVSNAFAQNNQLYTVDVAYEFPVTPFDEEWEEFETTAEARNACQIPEELLETMTTEALLETVLKYPFLIEYLAYNNYADAAEKFMRTFNGFEELFSRNDLTEALLSLYQTSSLMTAEEFESYGIAENVDNFSSSPLAEEISENFFETSHLEFLIAYDQILNDDYSEEEAALFDELLMRKIDERNDNELYSAVSETYAYYMQQEYPISVAAGEYATYSTVKTPKGTSVEVITFSPDYTSAEKAEINTYYDELYPSAERQTV